MPSFWHYNRRSLRYHFDTLALSETTALIYLCDNCKKLLTLLYYYCIIGAPAPKKSKEISPSLWETTHSHTHGFYRFCATWFRIVTLLLARRRQKFQESQAFFQEIFGESVSRETPKSWHDFFLKASRVQKLIPVKNSQYQSFYYCNQRVSIRHRCKHF